MVSIHESCRPSTAEYKNNTALSAWFCVDALDPLAMARSDKNAVTSAAPISVG